MVNFSGKYNIYTGHLKCSDCGASLCRFKKPKGNTAYYYCNTYKKTKRCSKHYITEDELNNAVINSFNNYINLICYIDNKIDEIIANSKIDYEIEINKMKLIEIKKDINKYENLINELIKDYELNYISKEDYDQYKNDYLYNLNNLKIKKDEIEAKKLTGNNFDWIKEFKKNKSINKVTRNIINEFIDDIIVDNERNIKIIFKYKDRLEEVTKFLKTHNSVI